MQLTDFHFELPQHLIAYHPLSKRSNCRLLYLDNASKNIIHGVFTDLLKWVQAGDLLILNDTQVIPARILGYKSSGGRVEVLIEKILVDQQALAQIRASHAPRIGSYLYLGTDKSKKSIVVQVAQRCESLFKLQFHDTRPILNLLQEIGHIPLPPYIKRSDSIEDQKNYQTIYARVPGAVAAPTAGLHFDQPLIDALQANGVKIAYLTLHIGAGTFQPIRTKEIVNHTMHAEHAIVSQHLVDEVLACKARGQRIIAVGTTVVRALEHAAMLALQQAKHTIIAPFSGDTRLFIYPGYHYRIVDLLITNFHLPCSSLLMLVCAFAGWQQIMKAYKYAISLNYRFFSYGDSMLLTRAPYPQAIKK